jgi:thiosulfate reductase cytochrome b subunit
MDRSLARLVILAGIVLVLLGITMLVVPRIPWLGRLPGDFRWSRGTWTISAPIATSLILSLILTIIINLISRR